MRELAEAAAEIDGGLGDDLRPSRDRGLTLLSAEQWKDVTRELGVELPWHTRRANLLIDGVGSLNPWIGRTIEIGEVLLEVLGETEPCGMMERLHAGLRRTLEPDCRGGVHGRVLRGGTVRVGDPVILRAENHVAR
jgi:MOSC domain-containing protein YiiM